MKFLNKAIEYGLYLLIFLLSIQTRWIIKAGETEYATYSLYGTDILLVLVILLFVAYKFSIFNFQFLNNFQLKNFQTKCKSTTWHLIGGLIIISAVSALFAVDRLLALYKFSWLVLGAGLFWLMAEANYSRVKLVWSLFFSLAFQAGLAIWQFLTQSSLANKWLGLAWHNGADLGASVIEAVGADGSGERWLRAYGGTDYPNILGGILAVGILLLFGITNKIQNTKLYNIKLLTSYFLLIIFSAALFFSFSRGAWLALTLGIGAMLIGAFIKKNFQAQKNILQAVLISGLVGFILFFQFPNLVMARLYGGARLEIKSNNERVASIKNSWPIIKNNLVAGVGPGNYTLILSRQAPGQKSFYYQPAHNVFMLVWAETGILGLIFFVGLMAYLVIFNFQCSIFNAQFSIIKFSNYSLKIVNCKLKIGENDSANNAIINLAVLIALIVMMSLDHWLWSLHFGMLFFWLVLGVIAGSKRDKELISI